MPWKACSAMEERLRFVARLLEGEAMTDLCREFGISRKTGYKLFNRYKDEGSSALTDRSRRPVRYANQLPPQIESLIVGLKRDKPALGRPQAGGWGGIRTHETVARLPVFKTGAFNRSATHPSLLDAVSTAAWQPAASFRW